MMTDGRVCLNGEVVTEMGTRVRPGLDEVTLDGAVVRGVEERWIAFHKPPGILTTRSDPHGGQTVYDVLPEWCSGLRYVGRLDRDAEGLLLMTNAGGVAHGLQHPSREVERAYHVEVAGTVKREALAALTTGVELDDGLARARRVRDVVPGRVSSELTIVLTEGRKREVRRMLSAVGHPVMRLTRTRFGPVSLGQLERGAWRELTRDEVAALERASR